jgi:hypothetical protein
MIDKFLPSFSAASYIITKKEPYIIQSEMIDMRAMLKIPSNKDVVFSPPAPHAIKRLDTYTSQLGLLFSPLGDEVSVLS